MTIINLSHPFFSIIPNLSSIFTLNVNMFDGFYETITCIQYKQLSLETFLKLEYNNNDNNLYLKRVTQSNGKDLP